MLVKYNCTVSFLSALIIASLLFWSGCAKYGTEPDNTPPPNQNPNILSLSNASGAPGDTGIIVDVNLHSVEDVGAVALRIAYDAAMLEPSDTPFLQPARAAGMDKYEGNFDSPGLITFLMISLNSPPGKIEAGDGPILHLIFDVKSSAAPGTTQIFFADNPNTTIQDNQLSDTTGNVVIFPQLQNGTFTVQ